MSKEKIYPKGIRMFEPREGAPDFVKAKVIIDMRELTEWFATQQEHYRDYQGKKQLHFNLLEGNKGMYMTVDTFKAQEKRKEENSQDLPF